MMPITRRAKPIPKAIGNSLRTECGATAEKNARSRKANAADKDRPEISVSLTPCLWGREYSLEKTRKDDLMPTPKSTRAIRPNRRVISDGVALLIEILEKRLNG